MKNVKLITIAFLTFLIAVSTCSILKPNKVKAVSSQIEDITRMGGTNRFETSVKIAKQGWTHSDNVVLADAQGNDAFADAISGTSLAYYLDCPILLTNTNDTPNVVKDEISQLGVKNIYILGGTGVISNSQEDNLKSNGYNVTRIAGFSRFDTACKAADILNSKSKIEKVYIAPADKFQYPLIVAPYAARENGVVLFTSGNDINDTTKNEILKLGVKDVSIVGSYNIVSYDAEAQLESLGINCFRMHGTTPQSIASDFINTNGNNSDGISIASGKMFPDALSGSVLTAKNNYNILLVDDGLRYTLNNNVKHAFIFGGTGAVSDNLENYIKSTENSRDISNAEIYQLYSDAWVSMEDIMFSVSNKEEYNKRIMHNGIEYVPVPEQYNSVDKIKDVLSNYYTEDNIPTSFLSLTNIDGQTVVNLGNVGESFYYTKKVLTNRQNIDSNTIQVNYNQYGGSDYFVGTITVTLSFENNSWKVSNIKYIDK
ncbi:cell wall-binding repeat-containing protein [Clostridium coskatii]|jgi:putative cell wall-binding protein|uniref:N-acetylmuramoyl-L-alanine amidase LytC n=1 Tax=Clostridium coskatii TaxID=1705578 RepID=A0A162LHE9_9CLOT|nr:cell wall-binding repeat-containing protein [Clostridium coskatii]OAA93546.1 N-acetylmuramoyl-L-alanine amidase LytC precursor [Clostridium coskatii]OBR96335.1 N-acetylmuramoyl-L-alanine amidase LytC precursor [Clostridium coskatii]